MYEAYREVDVMDGRDRLSSFEVRYTFTITAGRAARTWANAADGFHPAEDPSVEIASVATRWHPKNKWVEASGDAFDMLTADVPDAWFIAQAMEQADA